MKRVIKNFSDFYINPNKFLFQIDSEDDKIPGYKKDSIDLSSTIPSGTNKAPGLLDSFLTGLPDKWRNWIVRGVFSIIMITFFLVVIYYGPLMLILTVSYIYYYISTHL